MARLRDEPYQITIEIADRQCKVSRMLKDLGIKQFKVIDIRGLPGGLTRHLVKMPSKQLDKIPRGSLKMQDSSTTKREVSGWLDSDGCDICNAILSQGSFLISGRSVDRNTLVYTFISRSFSAFRNITTTLEDAGLKPKVLEVGVYKSERKILTEKQERALWLALKLGFFEYPRKIRMFDLSRRLGIKSSTLSEMTRRGIRRLLKDYFET